MTASRPIFCLNIFRCCSYDLDSCDEHVRRPSWDMNDEMKMQMYDGIRMTKFKKHIEMTGELNEEKMLYKGIVAKG